MQVSFVFDVWRCIYRGESLGVKLLKVPLGILLGFFFFTDIIRMVMRYS